MRATKSAPSRVRFAADANGGAGPSRPSAVGVAVEPQAASGPSAAEPCGHSGQPTVMLQPPAILLPWPVETEAGPSTSNDNSLPPHPDEHLLHRPLFMLDPDERLRVRRLREQRAAERLRQDQEDQEDQASDALSQDAGRGLAPRGEWSSSESSASTATPT